MDIIAPDPTLIPMTIIPTRVQVIVMGMDIIIRTTTQVEIIHPVGIHLAIMTLAGHTKTHGVIIIQEDLRIVGIGNLPLL